MSLVRNLALDTTVKPSQYLGPNCQRLPHPLSVYTKPDKQKNSHRFTALLGFQNFHRHSITMLHVVEPRSNGRHGLNVHHNTVVGGSHFQKRKDRGVCPLREPWDPPVPTFLSGYLPLLERLVGPAFATRWFLVVTRGDGTLLDGLDWVPHDQILA
ncbi:unnamed protein product [Sphenostylis stenocarpa]|uniref:Uncharacterized protein n=1 Tax=Sphenostylis stenocarpa TaxID=92480 RepID=A0AA86VYH5_9FABA|nr:unnamed protein product [Sphenostylis stenocarpa]